MADTRYLKQRRQGWYFQLKVPVDVAGKWGGSNPVVLSLGTRDLTKAQAARWPLVSRYVAHFEVLRGNRQWTPDEIEEQAELAFKEALAEFDRLDYDAASLSQEIDQQAEIIEADERRGVGHLSELERAKAWAIIHAANGRTAALQGEVYKRPVPIKIDLRTLQPITPKNTKGKGVKFSEAAQRYIEETQRDPQAKLTEQTKGQYEAVYRLFDQWAEQPTMDAVSRAAAGDFLDAVGKLSPTWRRSPQTKARSFDELVRLYSDQGRGLSNRTLNRYATSMNLVWDWARDRGLHDGANPWEGQHRRTGEKRKTEKLPFTAPELGKLLDHRRPDVRPARLDSDTTLPWLCWIVAYSGMRLNEICGLRVSDLKQEDGIRYFDVSKAKTEAGDRKVPIHSTILGLGLLDYARHSASLAEANDDPDWLFPSLKAGWPGWQARVVHDQAVRGVSSPPRRGEGR
jgi:integrase